MGRGQGPRAEFPLSGKSGGRWHHVMLSQTAAAKRGKRAKNTPAGSRPKEGGSGAEGLITHTKLTSIGAPRFPSPSRGLAARTPRERDQEEAPWLPRSREPGSAAAGPPGAGQPGPARPALCLRDWWPRQSPGTGKQGGGGGRGGLGSEGGGGEVGSRGLRLSASARGGGRGMRWKLQQPV